MIDNHNEHNESTCVYSQGITWHDYIDARLHGLKSLISSSE